MLSPLLKRVAQNAMLSAAPDAYQVEMNSATVEDTDFIPPEPDGRSPLERASAILDAMTLKEKMDFVTGYKSLGIHAMKRLGLPSVWMSDATSGPRCYGATTAFPSAVAMAAGWDRDLAARSADHIAEAARAKGVSILLGPGVNIARLPTCGRNFEYMGEDPYLAGELAAAYIRACTNRGVICTVKHLAVNNSEYDRHKISSDLDERTLREIYLPAFEIAVREGEAPGLMSAYNPVNGTWASENHLLLTEILRDEWGFNGFVVSDWNSLYSTAGPMRAGLDIEMPKARWLTEEKIQAALDAGEIDVSDLNRMCGNLLKSLFAAGVYDRPVKDPEAREYHPEHDEAALEAARAGIVLLKNEGSALPLPDGPGITIALCGPLAVESATLGGGSCHVARTTGTVSLADGMEAISSNETRIVRVPWHRAGRIDAAGRRILAQADAVVVACGFTYMEESELYDRSWRLPRSQRRLIEAASVLNSRTTVTLTAGGGVETASWAGRIPALVHGLYLGQMVGQATAEVLFGRVNPSGRLPFTMARRWTDIAAVRDYPRRYWTTTVGRMAMGQGNPRLRSMRHWNYSEGMMVGYRHFDTNGITPAFPFGHGLSYTEFEIGDVSLSADIIGPDDSLEVAVTLRNTGGRDGAEVVQVYVADSESRLSRPEKELKGFARLFLGHGESGEVTITLTPRAFRYWDPDAAATIERKGAWVADAGEFRILIGRSSKDIRSEKTVTLKIS